MSKDFSNHRTEKLLRLKEEVDSLGDSINSAIETLGRYAKESDSSSAKLIANKLIKLDNQKAAEFFYQMLSDFKLTNNLETLTFNANPNFINYLSQTIEQNHVSNQNSRKQSMVITPNLKEAIEQIWARKSSSANEILLLFSYLLKHHGHQPEVKKFVGDLFAECLGMKMVLLRTGSMSKKINFSDHPSEGLLKTYSKLSLEIYKLIQRERPEWLITPPKRIQLVFTPQKQKEKALLRSTRM